VKSLGSKADGLRLERMRASLQWGGSGFRNVTPILPGLRDPAAPFPSMIDFIRGGGRRAPESPLPTVDPRPVWAKPLARGLRVTWLGHSSVLLEIDGYRLLTDPVWGSRASPFSLVGPKRFQPPAVALADLPPLDGVVISHDHYDHLDYPTLRALAKTRVPFITSLGVGAHLEGWGVSSERITELDWWESCRVAGSELTVTAAPSQHFSGRGPRDHNATLWSSMVIATPNYQVFFSGDTGLTPDYERIAAHFGRFDLVMLEIGAFHPAWGDKHLGPENALKAWEMLGSGAFMPVHWGTFSLALHDWDQPVDVLLTQADADAHLLLPRLGQVVEPHRGRLATPWWHDLVG